VVAAGVGDDPAFALVWRQGSDLVVGSAELEGSDGLLVFGLEVEAEVRVGAIEFDQARAHGDALEAGSGAVEIVEGDHSSVCFGCA
jgi:hypothetical protein